jgi:hypothetical protein
MIHFYQTGPTTGLFCFHIVTLFDKIHPPKNSVIEKGKNIMGIPKSHLIIYEAYKGLAVGEDRKLHPGKFALYRRLYDDIYVLLTPPLQISHNDRKGTMARLLRMYSHGDHDLNVKVSRIPEHELVTIIAEWASSVASTDKPRKIQSFRYAKLTYAACDTGGDIAIYLGGVRVTKLMPYGNKTPDRDALVTHLIRVGNDPEQIQEHALVSRTTIESALSAWLNDLFNQN